MAIEQNIGGLLSILALNGLFTLILEFNLDYPLFYHKLYALLDRNVLHVKYRSRFFRLVDLFLSSNMLPSKMVASFIKRIFQLSLWAPPSGIILTLPLVFNLLRKHPLCIQMIHRSSEDGEVQSKEVLHGKTNHFWLRNRIISI